MKRTLSLVLQTVLFLVVFLAGTIWDPFHLKWFVTHPTLTSTRYFVPDGLILMLLLGGLIAMAGIARKRSATAAITVLAMLLAVALGLLSRFGFATHDLF